MATEDLGNTEWERSKISPQDINLLKKLGISKKQDALRFPSEESYPTPPMEYRVSFVDHLIRGLSAPIHNFLRGFLFITMTLHHLFLPFLKVEMSKNGPLSPTTTKPLMKEFIRLGTQFVGYRDHTKKLEGDLAEANKRADALATKLEQSEKAREKAEQDAKKAKEDAATVGELRKRLHDAETSLSENITQQSAREQEILTRLESQCRRFIRRTGQEYELEGAEGDQLLDALSLLEIHCDEARDGLTEAKVGLPRLFPYFFKKKEMPATFVALAKCFSSQENLGLQLRQEGLKVGVEGTIALVADSQQDVDWAKVGDTEEMETKKWQALIKAAKPNSKKILAYLGYDPTPAPSSSKPEVK
ncbi:hypothetical protein QYE76_070142 [Lolium multiflorum]|uniref:Uncharacterized protein n=1 Tax=Lolium multiflorum TaxID=4521 RepID=A0AAD8WFL0_LOLMU|nr:hypothetical protein QYE76_070142 [Lolium multiflorum]